MIEKRPRGRPGRYARLEALEASLVPGQKKRATYCNGIGLLMGARDTTAFVKLTLRKPNSYKGKALAAGDAVEIRLGSRASWTWEQLEAERVRLQGLADRGEPLEPPPVMTFSALAKEWLALKKEQPSWANSNGCINLHLEPTFGGRALPDISVGTVDRWVSAQRKTHKPASVQRQLNTLKAILNYGLKIGVIDRNPCDLAETIRGIESRRRHLLDHERKRMFEAALEMEKRAETREKYRDHELKGWLPDFLMWALHSGMRRGEMVNLLLSDISQTGEVWIVDIRKAKNGKARRIRCSPEMVAITERMRKLPREKGDDRLFPVSLTTVKRRLTKFWVETGLEDARLHDLRRTHATELVSEGVSLYEVASRLGHSNLDMLEGTYAVFKGDHAAATKAEEIFARTPAPVDFS